MKLINAFSMLEIVLVLAVLAILMGIGWTGLINFRSTAEMQNAYSELVSVIKTVQNRANNSVSSTSGLIPDFYVLVFSQNRYYSFNCCYNDRCIRTSPTNSLICTKDETINYRVLPADIVITPDSQCRGMGFGRLTGKFISLAVPSIDSNTTRFSSNIQETGICKVEISHTQIASKRDIEFNLNINSLNVKQ